MKDAVQPVKAMYSFGYESKARALNGFAEMFNLPDFEERRAKLVAGLDRESAATVDRILCRLKTVLKLKEGEAADLYTKEEQKSLADSKRLLQDKIVQLAPDLFVWNGYALPHKHFESNVFLDGYGLRFIKTLGNIGDKAIIDAGAYIGDSALMLSPLTTGKVYAFEPMLENFSYLEKTIWLNGLDNVVPVHKALGDKEGTLTMTVGDAGACATVSNRIPGDNLKEESVNVVKLDDFVRDEDVYVGLIKTDVEGAEQMLLRGAMETIRRDKPILLISIYHNASDFLDIKPMIESWNLGYRFQIYHPPIKSISGETVLIAECIRRGERRRSGSCIVPELQSANRRMLKVCAEAVALRNAKLAERDRWLAAEKAKVADLEAKLKDAQAAVDRRNAWVDEAKAAVVRRDAKMADLEAKLKDAQAAIDRRNAWVDEAKAAVVRRDAKMADLESRLKEEREKAKSSDELLRNEQSKVAGYEAELKVFREIKSVLENL